MHEGVHSRGRPLKEPLEPINDEYVAKLINQSQADACDALLALLVKHHPEHERAVVKLGGDKGDI